jgi:SAM-dependent methyltransferase
MQDHDDPFESQEAKHSHRISVIHAPPNRERENLAHLLSLISPSPNWRVLDITAGLNETAPLLAEYVHSVVALDVSLSVSAETQASTFGQKAENILFCHAKAEHLPFANASFDCVTAWFTPHCFSNTAAFAQEAARVLVAGGKLVLADLTTSGEPHIARYINTLNILRDPSHGWAFSLDDWTTFFFSAGLVVTHSETLARETDFDEWATGITGSDLIRLRVLITRAPCEVQAWLRPREVGHRLIFTLTEGIVVGYKP